MFEASVTDDQVKEAAKPRELRERTPSEPKAGLADETTEPIGRTLADGECS